jgi:hypothetical protein
MSNKSNVPYLTVGFTVPPTEQVSIMLEFQFPTVMAMKGTLFGGFNAALPDKFIDIERAAAHLQGRRVNQARSQQAG